MFTNRLLTRRRALHLGLSTLAGLGACTASKLIEQTNQVQALYELTRDLDRIGETPLQERAEAKGLIYGVAVKQTELNNPEFAASVIQESGMIVPISEFRWNWLNPSPDDLNFTQADSMIKWAKNYDLLVRGHTLIYTNSMPKWFWSKVNRQNAEQILLDYIKTVAGRYAGQIHSWDVVNEAVFPQNGRLDGLRNTRWLELLGPDYIELAFRAAAEADPHALLVYNDFGMDTDTEDGEAQRIAILRLLEHLKSKGTPIHALGMQGHIWGKDQKPLNPRKIKAFVREVADLDLKILVTELDVKDTHLPQDIDVRDRIIAQAYQDYLSVILDEPAVIAVITWGLSDLYTWRSRPQYGARSDGASVRPLPLDKHMNRKLAWYAMARAFDNAPSR
jgi:endo-1,4-beta-xylanase